MDRVERFVTSYYETEIKLDAERIADLKPKLVEKFDLLTGYRAQEVARCEKELAGLRDQRRQLVDSHLANPKVVPLDLLEVKQADLEGKISKAEARLERVGASAEKSAGGLEVAHQLLEDASGAYGEIDPLGRQRLNQVFFTKLRVSPDGIMGAELTDEYAGMLADEVADGLEKMDAPKAGTPFDGGSTFDRVVEAPRFELGSADAVRRCLQV